MSTLRISIIQSKLFWEDKPANLAMFEQKINSIREKTEIVILPEMFSTGFSMQPKLFAETMEGETVSWMKRMATSKNIILTGSFMCKEDSQPAKTSYYNRLVWMLPSGEYG